MNLTSWRSSLKTLAAGFSGAVALSLFPAIAPAQVVTTDRDVSVHATPTVVTSDTGRRRYAAGREIAVLPKGASVTLTPDPQRGSFFKIRRADGSIGWVHGRYLLLPEAEPTVTTVGPEAGGAPAFPSCGPERHYRWKQKSATSGFNQTPTSPRVRTALNWAVLPFSGHDRLSWCRDRSPRETKAFSITGWVRRTRNEDDGDVHIEITQNASDSTGDCFVVEIPAAELHPKFEKARSDLAALLSVAQIVSKDFDNPTRIKFTGLAFWDGWHATPALPINHGRCNSTRGAAWELHPVFKVSAP